MFPRVTYSHMFSRGTLLDRSMYRYYQGLYTALHGYMDFERRGLELENEIYYYIYFYFCN